MTSTRLAKKVMLPLCSSSVLETMIQRIPSFHKNIIIATTDDGSEEPIIDLCKRVDLRFFQGSTPNVLQRYYLAAKSFGALENDIIVRCTSDCPLIQEEIISATISYFNNSNLDYASAGVHSGFPRGMDTEVFNFSLLKKAYINAKTDYEKEHVTPYIHTTIASALKIGFFKNSKDHSHYRLTLDEEDDYKTIKEVYKGFDCQTDFSYTQLINFLELHPEIAALNQHVEQKKS